MDTKGKGDPQAAGDPRFKGRELVRAAKGVNRDLLSVLLEPEGMYTQKEAEKILEKALSKGVNADAGR